MDKERADELLLEVSGLRVQLAAAKVEKEEMDGKIDKVLEQQQELKACKSLAKTYLR